MFCGKCGAQNNPGNRFCGQCGAELDQEKNGSLKKAPLDEPKSNGNAIAKKFIGGKSKLTARQLTIVAAIVIAFVVILIVCNGRDPLIGTWEERSFTTPYGTSTYEAGEGEKITLGNNGAIIDTDLFLGQEFGYAVPVDILSWKAEGDTLLFYTRYNEVEYVPYTLRGKTLTLHFTDERSAELHKVQ